MTIQADAMPSPVTLRPQVEGAGDRLQELLGLLVRHSIETAFLEAGVWSVASLT
jgi:hypothetical protein